MSNALLPRLAAASLLVLPLVAGSPPALGQDAGADEARAVVRDMVTTEGPRIWQEADRLRALGSEAVPAIREGLADAPPWARLGMGRALVDLEEYGLARSTLLALAGPTEARDVRIGALGLLGEVGPRMGSIAERDELVGSLGDLLVDELDPLVRIALWKALYNLTRESDYRRSIEEAFEGTSDAALRAEAALALGEIGSVVVAKEVLSALAAEPTERGRLASAVLQREDAKRESETLRTQLRRMKRELREKEAAAAAPAGTAPPAAGAGGKGRYGIPGFDTRVLEDTLRYLLQFANEAPDPRDRGAVEDFVRERVEEAARGLANGIDPYTAYFDAKDRESWTSGLNNVYGGIGAYVEIDEAGFFSIRRPMFGSPAWDARLQPGDRVLEIDGWSTVGEALDAIITRLKGTPGTDTVLRVQQYGRARSDARNITVTRAQIHVPASWATLLPGGIGYIQLEGFNAGADEEIRKHITAMEKEGLRALVLDLRWNGGGYLDQAVAIASLFLPRGKQVVSTEGRRQRLDERVTRSRGPVVTVPLAVLINGGSASASEILAGALDHHDRAVLVGQRSFGKGSVQNMFDVAVPPYCEEYSDVNRNGTYDAADLFEDLNSNGRWDVGERITWDRNGDGRWTDGEPFIDANENGRFDCPAVKITIAKYHLPDGRSPAREKRKTLSGREVWVGGVEPDIAVANDEFEGWKVDEAFRIIEKGGLDEYLDALMKEHEQVAVALAQSDGGSPDDYPGFDEWMAALSTPLDREDVWRIVRARLRLRASDALGRPLIADYLTDAPLQRALLELLERAGVAPESVEEFAPFRDRTFAAPVDDREELMPLEPSGR